MKDILRLIETIHDKPHKLVMSVAGAGIQTVTWLLGVSGASRSLLEVLVPYGRMSMIELLGQEPKQYVSSETATAMAKACFYRAQSLVEDGSPVIGLACTATIATDRPKKGDHRGCISAWTADGVYQYDLILDKGSRDRSGEEIVLSRALLNVLAQACEVAPDIDVGLISSESPKLQYILHDDPIDSLLRGSINSVVIKPDGTTSIDEKLPLCLYPGSFRPLHVGHENLAKVASEVLNSDVLFEISIQNVDKPPLTKEEIISRVEQFNGKHTVVLTMAETFYKKSQLFPSSTFVVGWDTAIRLFDPKYYSDDPDLMFEILCKMSASGTKFLVAGREKEGVFMTLEDVQIPEGFRRLFTGLSEDEFRADISSTELRQIRKDYTEK